MQVTAKNITTLGDGAHRLEPGVYLRVKGTARFWVFKYQKDGKRRELGLGGADQTITTVRGKAAKFRAMLADGIDPKAVIVERKEERRQEAEAAKAEAAKQAIPTFADFYAEALRHISYLRQWRNSGTEKNWWRITETQLLPAVGHKRLSEITASDLAECVKPFWERPLGEKTLTCARGILAHAQSKGFVEKNAAAWEAGLCNLLPSKAVMMRGVEEGHRAAISPEDMQISARMLWGTDTIYAKALLFGILTVCRASEFRKAHWSEIDFKEETFSVPPERRKDGRSVPHVVPLSRQAQKILEALPNTGDFIFPSRAGTPVSPNSLLTAMRSTTDQEVTTHGLRSTFSDWCARNGKNFLVSEKCLMHAVGNQVFRAYQRDDLLDQRRELLQEWADYLLPDVG